MRRLISVIALLVMAACADARFGGATYNNECVFHSSFTKSNENATLQEAKHLKAVVVSSASLATASITLYDCANVPTSRLVFSSMSHCIGVVALDALGYYEFDVWLDSGLQYVTSQNSNGVSLIWRRE